MEIELSQVSDFIERYQAFLSEHQEEKIRHYKSEFGSLISGYKERKINFKARDRKEATRFNINSVLNV